MVSEDGKYKFRRYQLDDQYEQINVFEQEVDWILGSGAAVRNYLYQTDAGELFQLPIAYYAQEKIWQMSPGFDRKAHDGVGRQITRECMFCHNGYPEVAEGADTYGMQPVFPTELPQGIGCQRCHGPGAEHARVALAEPGDEARLRAAIVNPAKLSPKLRDDVCDQCHLQPSVALFGTRRFERSDYSYRAGQPLDDYLVQLEVEDQSRQGGERFEINHHSYRLRQSRCFQESDSKLSCLTCHDPHRKVPEADREAHYRAACLKCHEPDQYQQAHAAAQPAAAGEDCASCHMQKRRTQDVVHVAATDHLIRRQPRGEELLAPLREIQPQVTAVGFLDPEGAPADPLGEIYRAVAVIRATGGLHAETVDRLQELLPEASPEAIEPYLDLARGQIRQQRYLFAQDTLNGIIERDPLNRQAREWLGLTAIGLSRLDEAEEHLLQVLRDHPNSPEAHYNLGLALLGQDEDERARKSFEQAVQLRPNLVLAWYYLGRANKNLNRLDEAIAAFKQTLSIEPAHTRAYLELGQALIDKGDPDAARRLYRHGLKVASRLAPIAQAIDKLENTSQ